MQRLLGGFHLKRGLEDRWHRLYRLAYSWCHDPQLSKDLVQDTVAKALKNSHQLRDEQLLDTWLFRILVNCWRDFCRKKQTMVDFDSADLGHDRSPEEEHGRSVMISRVRKAVSALRPEHREVVTLVDLEQMSYKDVAEVLGIPIGTVMSRLCRARNQLKEALRDFNVEARRPVVRKIK